MPEAVTPVLFPQNDRFYGHIIYYTEFHNFFTLQYSVEMRDFHSRQFFACWNVKWVFVVFLLLIYEGSGFAFSQPAGKAIYLQQCASCHGKSGQGVKGEYEDALYGDWSVGKIKRYIEKNMPEDDPDLCVGEDAVKVAQYVYQQFYRVSHIEVGFFKLTLTDRKMQAKICLKVVLTSLDYGI